MYTRLLREAVATLKGRDDLKPVELAKVELAVDLFIPIEYIADEDTRILFYRRLAEVTSETEMARVTADLADRFGPPPASLDGLFRVIRIRMRAAVLGIREIKQQGERVFVSFDPARPIPTDFVDRLLTAHMRRVTFQPDSPAFWLDLGLRKNLAILGLLEQVLEVPGGPSPAAAARDRQRLLAGAAPGHT
jgi:transcription-repair coupling factor (superfamily II helicase)